MLDRVGLYCGTHDPPYILRREELKDGHGPGHGAEEAIGLLLIVAQSREELLHLGRWRREGGELVRELVARQRRLVALPLVVDQRLFERSLPAEPGVNRLCQQFGIAKGVSDAERSDRVFMIAGIAHQCPPRAVGLAEEERQVRGTVETLAAFAVAYPFSQRRCEVQSLHEVACDVGAHLVESSVWPPDNRQGSLVIRGEGKDHPLWPWIKFRARDRHVAPVGVIRAGERGPLMVAGGLDGSRHQRAQPIGTDDDAGLLGDRCTASCVAADAPDAVAIHEQIGHGEAFAHLRASFRRRLDQDGIEHSAAWAISAGDAIRRWGRPSKGEGANIEDELAGLMT